MVNIVTLGATVNLQATLAASSSGGPEVCPHHPLTCPGELAFHDDGTFACEHVSVPAGDPRTRRALDHSMAILILEQLG